MATTTFNAFWDGPDKYSFGVHHASEPVKVATEQQGFDVHHYVSTDEAERDQLELSAHELEVSTELEVSIEQEDSFFTIGLSEYQPHQQEEDSHGITFSLPFSPNQSPLLASTFQPPSAPNEQLPSHYVLLPQQLGLYENTMNLQVGHNALPIQNTFSLEVATAKTISLLPPIVSHPFIVPLLPQTTVRRMRRKRGTYGQTAAQAPDDNIGTEEQCDVALICSLPNCSVCYRDLPECLRSNQPTYFRAAILRVVFYTLKLNYPQKEFFNLRNHVYDFVDAHWGKICVGKIKSEHWKKQLQDTLAHNKKLFASGADVFKQKGFWRLESTADPWEEKVPVNAPGPKQVTIQCIDDDNSNKQRKQRSQKKPKFE